MTEELRQRIADAVDECRTLTPAALTDAVLVVVQPELDRLQKRVNRRGTILRSMERQAELSLAVVVEICKERNSAHAAIDRVRALHQPTQHMGQAWCDACSVRRRTGPNTHEWVARIPHPCPTLDALEEGGDGE